MIGWGCIYLPGSWDYQWTIIGLVAVITFLGTAARRHERRCGWCQHDNRRHARFCAHCGARLAEK